MLLLIFSFFYSPRFLHHRGAILIYNLCYHPVLFFGGFTFPLPRTKYNLFAISLLFRFTRTNKIFHPCVDDFIYSYLFIILILIYFLFLFLLAYTLFHQKRGGTTERFQTEFKAKKQTTNKQPKEQTNKEEDEFERGGNIKSFIFNSWASRGTNGRTRLWRLSQTTKGGCID